jgi:hypothetical protein
MHLCISNRASRKPIRENAENTLPFPYKHSRRDIPVHMHFDMPRQAPLNYTIGKLDPSIDLNNFRHLLGQLMEKP